MHPGEIIANAFAAGLVIILIAVFFLIFGKPLWPERHVRMVIIPPAHRMTTAIKSAGPDLPNKIDLEVVRPRPTTNKRT
ncbi:hypothetical protein EN904_28775 [Mesorhizobium sp. M7A.F.Ca.CA.001.07.2.1]|uniref:hypothetical protein n=1 Tax=Mesorhizobium TaxID=68287 RepID=UPI000FCB2B2A|nr:MULTISPECIES: hypothetical protein [Mesorhizobium]RUY08287.1 hypothetical protein EN985_00440 [Mesorhizobium sp. M7A.F.Ca.CA.004.04.1.1]RUY21417.1 hypothetical protein EN984_21620 [Mesorhizobium sp. M7A.F.Ca.CA.004.12.1.1]RVB30181.1 hypothetical protein EN918_21375 [Mesorhizobium sp. M7A.F.Ca.CA.004.05.1.1]MCF6127954.1 hypothetical protein [Mesorhizobium ciceri]MCQ8817753.1 hypothetical protein [Mesorhizobium sp. SEMIA396]